MSNPNPIPAGSQSIVGMTLGAVLGVGATIAGRMHLSVTMFHYIIIFVIAWIGIFFAIKRGLVVLVVTASAALGVIFLVNQYFSAHLR
jgi:hypothetical protein